MLLRSLVLLILLGAPASAQTVYSLAGEGCAAPVNDGALRLGDGILRFHESTCTRASERRPLGEGWYEADWNCEGEGEMWQRRLALRIAEDRVQLRDEHGTAEFLACP